MARCQDSTSRENLEPAEDAGTFAYVELDAVSPDSYRKLVSDSDRGNALVSFGLIGKQEVSTFRHHFGSPALRQMEALPLPCDPEPMDILDFWKQFPQYYNMHAEGFCQLRNIASMYFSIDPTTCKSSTGTCRYIYILEPFPRSSSAFFLLILLA